VPTRIVFPTGSWHGFISSGLGGYEEMIRGHAEFMPRAQVEDDLAYQQIIPFLVFRHRDRYFLTRRLRASSERRLRQQYSLGLGGHVNSDDALGGDALERGIEREWSEEVIYKGGLSRRLIGLINDDSSPVSRVHLGLVYLVEADSDEIQIRETQKLSGELLSLSEMRIFYLAMESWSQIVYDQLLSRAW